MTKPNPDMNSEFRDYPTITADQLQKAITQDVHIKALRALSQVGADAAAKLRAQHQEAVASCLLASGVNLIPSEHLSDNQFVVSRECMRRRSVSSRMMSGWRRTSLTVSGVSADEQNR